ncbi:MAG: hypothetical protein JWM11_7645 [Planctomycetaceae bacterium]|nr:hypothetical protein [Planctomycetaceae bacterium]
MKSTLLLFALLMSSTAFTFSDAPDPSLDEESIKVSVTGTVRTGIVAIGGETTGVTIKSKNATFELEFGKNAALKKQADKLDGKPAIVEGTLDRKEGVEVKDRWIVTVTALRSATKPSKK